MKVLGHKVSLGSARKLGNKVVQKGALGLKKSGKYGKKVAAGLQAAGAATGQAELISAGAKLEGYADKAKRAGQSLEKVRKGEF